MKKTLFIALAGMMLFAFTQCGGGGVKGSKEYQAYQKFFEEFENIVKKAKSCEDLEEAREYFFNYKGPEVSKEEEITEEEREKLAEDWERASNLFDETEKRLCK